MYMNKDKSKYYICIILAKNIIVNVFSSIFKYFVKKLKNCLTISKK